MNQTMQNFDKANNDITGHHSFVDNQNASKVKAYHTTRNTKNQLETAPSIKRGSVALNLETDLSRYGGTWKKFNAEFEKRLNRKERATAMRIKKQKGETFKYPSTIWRSP